MHVYGKDQQLFKLHRTRVEKWFLHTFTVTVGVQIACLLFSISRTATKVSGTMQNSYFISTPLKLNSFFYNEKCGIDAVLKRGLFSSVHFRLDPKNIEYVFSRSATNMRMLFTCVSLHLVLSVINRLLVWMEVREVRYHFVVFRKDSLLVWELLLMVTVFVLISEVHAENYLLKDYLVSCGRGGSETVSSVVPLVDLYVSMFMTLFLFLMNLLVTFIVRCRKNPKKEMLREEARGQKEHEMLTPNISNERMPPPNQQLFDTSLRTSQGPCNATVLSAQQVPAAQVGTADFHPALSGFGPSVSRPQTPTTLGPEPIASTAAKEERRRLRDWTRGITPPPPSPPPITATSPSPLDAACVRSQDGGLQTMEESTFRPSAGMEL